MVVPQELIEAAAKVKQGEKPEVTVRMLLAWFGAYRRSWRNVKLIRCALEECGVVTAPDFEAVYVDTTVTFTPKEQPQADAPTNGQDKKTDAVAVTIAPTATIPADARLADAAHRISRLQSANTRPIHVAPDAPIAQAVTLMLEHNFSQIPVMTSEREVKGLISWKSLGTRLSLGNCVTIVRDGMDKHQELTTDASLFDAVRIIAEHECVLVRDQTKVICGIVTASDIGVQFQQLAEPFLLLGDIENHIRYLIDATFSPADLESVKDPSDSERKIEDASDLTFGEYVRLLQNDAQWKKLNTKIDRNTFIEELDRVRNIRNDVMHFDPDPIDGDNMKRLKNFAAFFDRLPKLTLS